MLTGCRLNEILTLRWDDIDRTAGELRLRDGKAGARMVPLTPTAETVLAGIARAPLNPWVIVGKQPNTHLSTITADWYRLRAYAQASTTCASTTSATATPAAPSPPARA